MSKIIIITNHSYMLYRFRKELIGELLKEHEVVLSMPFVGHEEDLERMGCRCVQTEIDRRGLNPLKDLKLLLFYWKLLRKERPDRVMTFSIKPNIYAGLVCSMLNIHYFANVQGLGTAFQSPKLAKFVTLLYKAAFRKVKTVFFENQVNAIEFRTRGILTEDKQLVLPGAGINLEQYKYSEYPTEVEPVHFLYLGRIMKEKGMDELFEAIRRLKERYGENVVLDLVGFFEDEYESQIDQMQKEGIVVFHGFQEEPIPFYKNAHCVVLPSYHEGMSNVLLEAAALGRPLITTDIPGCREAVDDGKTGFLCPKQDSEQLLCSMDAFMQLSPEERCEMGKKGCLKMQNEFDKKMVVKKVLKTFESTV